MIVFLDTTPLWTLCHPNAGPDGRALRAAVASTIVAGHAIAIAEINDYEARRELLRKNATAQLARLDQLLLTTLYHPIDTALMQEAATLWATLRQAGRLGASDAGLDGDVILAAQALRYPDHLIVTSNTKHFSTLCRTLTTAEFTSL